MDLLNLRAVLGLDSSKYADGLEKAKSMGATFLKATGGLLSGAAKATGAAMAGAAAGVVALTKQAYDAYSEYEQLKGGIETMFEDLSYDVEENAKKAFATTGMSANEYMNTVMGFSASLNQSLIKNEGNIARAAEASDQIVSDMADNVSKMGTTMESVQNAYAGFAKGNFTMLDNLKLGYGGTAAEMQRLLDDAEKLTGKKFNLDNFADIAEAIHVIQDEMGIAGNAADEASKTISGSVGAMKAAWMNLVTGFADPEADLGQLIDNVVNSASTALNNIVPVISRTLSSIGKAVEQVAPMLGEELPKILNDLLPPLLSAASSLIQSFADSLPTLLQTISDQLPSILNTIIPVAINSLVVVFNAISEAIPTLLQIISDNADTIMTGIVSIMDAVGKIVLDSMPIIAKFIEQGVPKVLTFIQNNMSKYTSALGTILKTIGNLIIKLTPVILPMMIQIGLDMLMSLTQGITENANEIVQGVMQIIQVLIETLTNPDTLMTILECGFQILMAITNGIAENLPLLFDCLGQLLANLILFIGEAIPQLVSDIGQFGAKVVTDILPQILTAIGTAVARMVLEVSDRISDKMIDLKNKASEFFGKIPEALMEGLAYLAVKIGEFAQDAIDFFGSGFEKIKETGKNIVLGLWNGIQDAKDWIIEKVKSFSSDVLDGIKKFFGISSPSKKTAVFGRFLAEGLAVGMEDEAPDAFSDIQDALDKGMNSLEMDSLNPSINGTIDMNSKYSSSNPLVSGMDKMINMLAQLNDHEWSITMPIYFGTKQFEEIYVDSKQNITVRSGGQVDA